MFWELLLLSYIGLLYHALLTNRAYFYFMQHLSSKRQKKWMRERN